MSPTDNYGAIAYRELGDGRALWVYPQMYTFKLVIGVIGQPAFTDCWCYKDRESVTIAYVTWNPLEEPEPTGWVRHPISGRRRFPDGDPATEEVRA